MAAETKARSPRYKSDDGDYLMVDEGSDGYFRIGWYVKEWEGIGGMLGESEELALKSVPPVDKSEWECWQADRTVAPLVAGRDSHGFYFETMQAARTAIREANRALFSGEAPWPAWAIQAKAAGWTPPKGWKP